MLMFGTRKLASNPNIAILIQGQIVDGFAYPQKYQDIRTILKVNLTDVNLVHLNQ